MKPSSILQPKAFFATFNQPKSSEYTKQAEAFLTKTDTKFTAEYLRHGKYFAFDTQARDIYLILLQRGNRKFEFEFGASTNDSGVVQTNDGQFNERIRKIDPSLLFTTNNKYCVSFATAAEHIKGMSDVSRSMKILQYREQPSAYDILTCLQKSDVGTLEDFCGEFGYDIDSKKADKIYEAVKNEWMNVCALWTDTEIEELQEIQ